MILFLVLLICTSVQTDLDPPEQPVGVFFAFPFVMGPGSIIGLAALLAGPIGLIWAETQFNHYGILTRGTVESFMESNTRQFHLMHHNLEDGFQKVFTTQDKQSCAVLMSEPTNVILRAFEGFSTYLTQKEKNATDL